MKIIQALVGGKELTAAQLTEMHSDIPQATMYRHLKTLLDNEFIAVVEQNQVRGTFEKVYALNDNSAHVTQEDVKNATPEDHMNYFMRFVSSLISDFGSYLQGENINLEKDGVGYRQIPLYLSDEEFMEFLQSMRSVVAKAYENNPSPERKARMFTTIIMPKKES